MLSAKVNDWGLDRIYEMEDNLYDIEENEQAIIDYLKDIRCSMPLGLALRRYLCGKFSNAYDENTNSYVFILSDGSNRTVSDYQRETYDIQTEDISAYTDVFLDINKRFNSDQNGNLFLEFPKAEAKRMLRMTGVCTRSKLFVLSFVIHMNDKEVHKFLTDVLAEQTYNYRQADEIIANYCHSHEKSNSYMAYLILKERYEKLVSEVDTFQPPKENYTKFAQEIVNTQIHTEEQLLQFLLTNTANFIGYSKTAYNEFMQLFKKALKKTKIQTLSNDAYLLDVEIKTETQRHEHEEKISRAIGLQQATNTEQLAREMLRCIPRAGMKKIQNGKSIITNDFISIYNGERGQKSKKVQTTTLPKEITMNLLMKDRLDDLIRQLKPVERKDLVFLRFYLFSLELEEKGSYVSGDCEIFMDECNDMLLRCGMSRLYPANRFENLILLSLLASNPFEMFEIIIEHSFINEPSKSQEE